MKEIKYLLLLFLSIFIALLTSCNSDNTYDNQPVNNYGGCERRNSYEQDGDFYRQLFVVEDYDSINAGGSITQLLALSEEKIIFPAVNGDIICIINKKVKWQFKLDSGNVAAAGMAADQKHNIYVIDNAGILYSISNLGKLKWKKPFIKVSENDIITFSDLLAQKNGIIAATSNGIIAKYSYSGKKIWQKECGLPFTKLFPSDLKGNISLPVTHNLFGETDTLIYINSDGKTIWKKAFEKTRIIKSPVISGKRIYLSCVKVIDEVKIPVLYCLDSKGKLMWKKEMALQIRFISAENEGRIYIGAYNGGEGKPISMIASLDSNGSFLWKRFVEVSIVTPIMIGEKIISFAGADNKASGLYFVRKNGNIENIVSLTEAPTISLLPTVAPGNIILFGSAEKTQIIRIDNTPMKKIIPW